MNLFEDTNPRYLKELLQKIDDREMVLPDFQRDFVWDANATQGLIVSTAFNYPAGSLLRIRNTKNLFAWRQFEGARPLNDGQPTYLVLDGQQRLTSLYQAFYGLGDHRYYLNIRRLLETVEFQECVFHLRFNHPRAKQYAQDDVQARDLILPLSVLKKGGTGEFGRWTRMVKKRFTNEGDRIEFEDKMSSIEDTWIRNIDGYQFPVVTLSGDADVEAVCTIFETLNNTGVKLSVFELLTARFHADNVKLRQLWEKAKEEHYILEDFKFDPYYILQIICLVSRSTPSCKRGDVLKLRAATFGEWWDKAVQGVAKALEILRDDCGVIVPRWLPYETIVVPFGAVLAEHQDRNAAEIGATRQKLCRWYWCSVFAQAYDNSPNSVAVKDLTEIRRWLAGGDAPDTVTKFTFDPSELRETTTQQRALYEGVISLILRNGPRDLFNGAKIDGDLMIQQKIDSHHIFPKAYLDRQGVPKSLRECVLNRTLINRKTNILINDRAPSVYLEEVRKSRGDSSFIELLDSHILPSGPQGELLTDNFEGFLAWREKAVWEEIKRVTGPPDLMLG